MALLIMAILPNLWGQNEPTPPTPPPPPPPPATPQVGDFDHEEFESAMADFEKSMKAWGESMAEWGKSMEGFQESMEDWGRDWEAFGKEMGAWGEKMGQFGEEMKEQLLDDGYIKKRNHHLRMKVYEDHMIVNGKKIEGAAYKPYQKIMKRYDIGVGKDGEMEFNLPKIKPSGKSDK